jgi:hypothetical protein
MDVNDQFHSPVALPQEKETLVSSRTWFCIRWICHEFMVVTTSGTKMSSVRGSVTNNNWFWIGWLDLLAFLLQLQSIITAPHQWLLKTHSIPYWTTTIFSSTVTDLVLIHESVTCHLRITNAEWRLTYECPRSCLHSRLYSLRSPWKMFGACLYPWEPRLIPPIWKTRSVQNRSPQIRISIETCVNFVSDAADTCLASRV